MSTSIERELERCRQSAEEGYKLAQENFSEIKATLLDAAISLDKIDREQNQVKRLRNTELVETQKDELKRLINAVKPIGDDLENLRGRTKEFSIVVYGRTMAGKSTLMEILTHGNGQSIGKGAQRTTRDVRDYHWNGLKITDVPGICAFEGAADEKLALEAAKAADLILFLLTGDAPQPDEAACLAQLKNLGKPVLGVLNVKMRFNINDELDIEDLRDKLADTQKINETLRQFKEFAAIHNQDWSGIKFVATHLLSAYLAQDKNPAVFKLSRFAEVERFILDKVQSDGRFLRIKTFADSVAVPMSNIILKIYEHSAATLLESDVWFNKRRQLDEWSKKFSGRSLLRIDNLYDELKAELDAAIYDFAEYHYEDEHVNENWQAHLRDLNFDGRYQSLLAELAEECQRKRRTLSDELRQELNFIFHGNTAANIALEDTTTWGKNISTALPLLALIPGVGWGVGIAIGVASILGNLISDDKEKKVRAAKEKLRKDLKSLSYELLDKMYLQVVKFFKSEILAKGVDEFRDMLSGYQFMLARLGKSQYEIAYKLFKKFSRLNEKLLTEAIVYKGAGYVTEVKEVARVPGELFVAFAEKSNLNVRELSDLLGEKFFVIKSQKKISATVKNTLRSDVKIDFYPLDFGYNPEKAVAIFPTDSVNATNFKIAQQIAGVPIITR
ncbi:MAG: 50S ribosome-binding GTPase [Selenomonadaceae bacterium]|nr:50S ribosome-binding GTPase [Selenomonadaceae bacterium]